MSRHGYSDDCDDQWASIRWRGAVESAIRGKRGQAFLREMLAALDAMPEKALVAEELVTPAGDVCAMGAVLRSRGVDVSNVDPEDTQAVAEVTGLAESMVREIAYMNDDWHSETPQARWVRMRAWVAAQLKPEAASAG